MADSKKKLVRITTVPESMQNLLRGQLKYMSEYYEVVAISTPTPKVFEMMLHEQGDIRGIPIAMERHPSPWKDLKALVKMVKVLREEKPFIVHTHTPKAGLLGMVAARIAGVPHRLHTVAGLPLLVHTGMKRKMLDAMERLTSSCATQVFPNSHAMMNIMAEEQLCSSRKMRVIGNGSSNGIDTTMFSPESVAKTKAQLREEMGFGQDDFVFVFVGRIVRDKGMNELANAIVRLAYGGKKFKVLLVGGYEKNLDPLLPETENVFNNHPNVKWVGPKGDVKPYLKASDALVFPSYREGFPNVVMEAGAMGLPAIVTDINGCNEIIVEHKNGRIIPPQNEEKLFQMMNEFINNREMVAMMASHARSMIVSRYERTYVWKEMLKIYNTL